MFHSLGKILIAHWIIVLNFKCWFQRGSFIRILSAWFWGLWAHLIMAASLSDSDAHLHQRQICLQICCPIIILRKFLKNWLMKRMNRNYRLAIITKWSPAVLRRIKSVVASCENLHRDACIELDALQHLHRDSDMDNAIKGFIQRRGADPFFITMYTQEHSVWNFLLINLNVTKIVIEKQDIVTENLNNPFMYKSRYLDAFTLLSTLLFNLNRLLNAWVVVCLLNLI